MSETYTTAWEPASPPPPTEVWVEGRTDLVATVEEVNGSVPVKAMIEVLESDWGRAQAWETIQQRHIYRRVLDQDVVMTIGVSDLGRVDVTRSVQGELVEAGAIEETRARHRRALDATERQGRLLRDELVARTRVRSLEIAQQELGLTLLAPPVIEIREGHFIYEAKLQIELTP